MDGKLSKTNLKNFRTNRPAVNSTTANSSSSTTNGSTLQPLPVASNWPSAVAKSAGAASRSPNRPSASALLKELHAANAALKSNAPASQAVQKGAAQAQARPATPSNATTTWKPTRSMAKISAARFASKNLPSNSAQPAPVTMPSTSVVRGTTSTQHTLGMAVASDVPPQLQHALSLQTAPSRAISYAPVNPSLAHRSVPTLQAYAQSAQPLGISSVATVGHHAIPPVPQAYEARGLIPQLNIPQTDQIISQRIYQLLMPSLTSIESQQANTRDQLLKSDQALQDLVVEVKSLAEREKAKERQEMERLEREKNTVKALMLLAVKMQDIKKELTNIGSVLGVERVGSGTILDRLGHVEMNVEEWLERVRDPQAEGMDVEENEDAEPSPAIPIPVAVRKEMAVSPIKFATPKAKVYSSIQVGTSLDSPTQRPAKTSTLCASCSQETIRRHSPDGLAPNSNIALSTELIDDPPNTQLSEVEDDSLTPTRRGKQKETNYPPQAQTTQTSLHHPTMTSTPIKNVPSVGSFSPVDWNKPLSNAQKTDAPTIVVLSPSADVTPTHKKSYVLPSIPEGTIAALRKEALGDPYPYPLQSMALSSASGSNDGSISVMTSVAIAGAGIQAAERMPSPESMCDVEPENDGGGLEEEEDQLIEEDQLVDEDSVVNEVPPPAAAGPVNQESPSKSQISSLTEDEDTVMSLVMEDVPPTTSPLPPPAAVIDGGGGDGDGPPDHSEFSPSRIIPYASTVHLGSPVAERHRIPSTEGKEEEKKDDDNLFAGANLSKLREWYTKTRTESLEKQAGNATTSDDQLLPPQLPSESESVKIEGNNVIEIEDSPVKIKKPKRSPPSIISISSDSDVEKGKRTKTRSNSSQKSVKAKHKTTGSTSRAPDQEKPPKVENRAPGFVRKKAQPPPPLFDLTSESDQGSSTPAPLSKLQRLIADLVDDDADVISVIKKERQASSIQSTSDSSSIKVAQIHSSNDTKKKDGSIVQPERTKLSQDQTPTPTTTTKKKSLLLLHQRKGPSTALTRIKKRKAPDSGNVVLHQDDDDFDQPPLKRAKLRTDSSSSKPLERMGNMSSSSSVLSSSSKRDKLSTKTPTKRLRESQVRAAKVVWPKIEKPTFDQFILCDVCDRWYHVGCVGVYPGDVRLTGSEKYHCPPCEAGMSLDDLSPAKNNRVGSATSDCSRPKCLRPIGQSTTREEETYVVEAFVGMKKKYIGSRGLHIQYLVKWLGYDYNEATWEAEQEMGLPNSGVFIEKFEQQAKKETLDLSQCNQQAILLKCAAHAGWNPEGVFVHKVV